MPLMSLQLAPYYDDHPHLREFEMDYYSFNSQNEKSQYFFNVNSFQFVLLIQYKINKSI